MPEMTASAPAAPSAPKGLFARAFGVLMSPRATYAEVAARPSWAGVLGLTVFVVVIGTFSFLSTEVGQKAALDQQLRSAESFGRQISDAQYAQLERVMPYAGYFAAVTQLIFIPLIALVIAGLAFAVFTALLGGDATFRQVFAVVAHSGVVIALQNVFSMPLDYVRETLTSPTNLAVFLPFLEERTFAVRLLGAIDLFLIWWAITLAIGLGVLYKRRTGPIATTILLVYVAIAVVIAAVRTALSGA